MSSLTGILPLNDPNDIKVQVMQFKGDICLHGYRLNVIQHADNHTWWLMNLVGTHRSVQRLIQEAALRDAAVKGKSVDYFMNLRLAEMVVELNKKEYVASCSIQHRVERIERVLERYGLEEDNE
jgi:hypothetical protein